MANLSDSTDGDTSDDTTLAERINESVQLHSDDSTASGPILSLSDIGAGWLTGLRGYVDTLVDFAKNPRGFIIGTLLLWLVGGVLGFFEAAISLLLSAAGLAAQAVGMPFAAMANVGAWVGGGLLSWLAAILAGVVGFFASLGWLAPIVAALLFVAVLEIIDTLSIPIANALSDLLGAIPVLGSLLDAGMTLVIGILDALGGRS
ncbi:MAG: hypothetical protein ABEJ47_01300 [Halorhabdus sp.]